jgi:hypothetical protein
MPEPYHFVTDWRFKAALQKVWSVVLDIERYPGWWKNFRRVQITRGDGKSVGSVIACEVRGSLPYSLNYALEVYHWDVGTTNPILNLVAPLAKGALARNHEQVMANGYAALRPHVES